MAQAEAPAVVLVELLLVLLAGESPLLEPELLEPEDESFEPESLEPESDVEEAPLLESESEPEPDDESLASVRRDFAEEP